MGKGSESALVMLLCMTLIALSPSNSVLAEETDNHDDSTPPVPIFEINSQVNEGPEPITLDASLSYDPGSDSDDLRYIWSGTRGADSIVIDYHEDNSTASMSIGLSTSCPTYKQHSHHRLYPRGQP